MLNRLRLENFKAWREADLDLGRVTGLFGTNSSGKSSLLQLLLLLKQTRNATDRGLVLDLGGPGDMVNLGIFEDVVHQRDVQAQLSWLLNWKLPTEHQTPDTFGYLETWGWDQAQNIEGVIKRDDEGLVLQGKRIEARCSVGLNQGLLRTYELAYRFGGVEFRMQPKAGSNSEVELVTDSDKIEFKTTGDRSLQLLQPVKSYRFPYETRTRNKYSDFLGEFELAFESVMDSIYYLGPLRERPRREYQWQGTVPDGVGLRGEYTVDAMLAATSDGWRRILETGKEPVTFQEAIAHWLRELGLIQEFRLEEIADRRSLYRTMVRTTSSSVPMALTDVGFGVSQVLPVLVLLYYVPERSTVLLEQPEIHLHPAVQSGLADVILSVAMARGVQIIVESHSEHLMRRLQRRVAEERVSSKDVKLYFVSLERGVARVSDLELNEFGEIENWPKDFFGDEMGEIASIAKASLRRKMERHG